ncbi:MAG: Peptidase [Candidatus Kaiserbacteria bacterium GW2011_GWA2_49_19]|uniref:Peptidase n=1 Tax=Candidatus Kaiserbacteria bacterium GW2011_GWA2_49_19 TaxID=1618669 RepID=A0A0G1VNN2_9BACT|nr:MAG: Peptidase [Candidatus Kaiserbacteria bacterium GW2011_GWA2_49_19]
MIQTLFQSPVAFLMSLLAIIAAISIHEFSHAWAADKLGDPTPRLQGRLTLNPKAHLDPIGTLMLILFRFGWGKPVMFDPFNLKNPRRDAMLIGLAGPASNLISAAAAALVMRLMGPMSLMGLMLTPFIVISVVLAVFNLVPVHPLDGGKIIAGLLPREMAKEFEAVMRTWGTMILIFLIFPWGGTSAVFYLIGPVVSLLLGLLLPGTGRLI